MYIVYWKKIEGYVGVKRFWMNLILWIIRERKQYETIKMKLMI